MLVMMDFEYLIYFSYSYADNPEEKQEEENTKAIKKEK